MVVTGSAVTGDFTFAALSGALSSKSGVNGDLILGAGLCAAGFTSAITAPLASAVTLKSLFGSGKGKRWNYNGLYFRLSWAVVLLIGMTFATLDIRPIPAIILAQALNGIVLPLISFILVYLVHDAELTGRRNSPLNSFLLGITLVITLIIGLHNLVTAISGSLDSTVQLTPLTIILYLSASIMIHGAFYRYMLRRNSK